MAECAVVLVNLGSPKSTDPKDVSAFLKKFLSDRRVVDAPAWYWKPLLYAVIAPLRSRRSSHAYQQIWWPEGSPIRVISQRQKQAITDVLQHDFADRAPDIFVAETYGDPSINQIMETIGAKGYRQILCLPLYPQYSATTTGAVFDQLAAWMQSSKFVPAISTVSNYCTHPDYIEALSASIKAHWSENGRTQKLLISFHGIPMEYVTAGDPYQQQCEATANAVAKQLQLEEQEWQISYQSRFGPKKWLQPYTDDVLKQWASKGYLSVTVVSPAFAADCLETLEELAIQSRKIFLDSGGQNYQLVPCLNDSRAHINLLKNLITSNLRIS